MDLLGHLKVLDAIQSSSTAPALIEARKSGCVEVLQVFHEFGRTLLEPNSSWYEPMIACIDRFNWRAHDDDVALARQVKKDIWMMNMFGQIGQDGHAKTVSLPAIYRCYFVLSS